MFEGYIKKYVGSLKLFFKLIVIVLITITYYGQSRTIETWKFYIGVLVLVALNYGIERLIETRQNGGANGPKQ